MITINEILKIKINKPGLKIELETDKPAKRMETLRCLISDINDIGADIKNFERDVDKEIEESLFDDPFGGRFSNYSKELRNNKSAKAIMDRFEKTSEMSRHYEVIADVKQSIDLNTRKRKNELDIESWKKAMQKKLYGLKIIQLQAAILHVIGKTISIDNVKTVKETALRYLNYPPCETFVTDKDLGNKIFVEIVLFGNFQKTYQEMLWDD